jgi:hypothetical protein
VAAAESARREPSGGFGAPKLERAVALLGNFVVSLEQMKAGKHIALSSRLRLGPIVAAFALALVAPAHAQDTLTIPRQQPGPQPQAVPNVGSQGGKMSQVLPGVGDQQINRQSTSEDNTRVIPTISPQQDVLVIPSASPDFIGKWGGHLDLARKVDHVNVRPPSDTIVSLLFGQRGGQIVMATTIYGSAQSQVLETKAASDGPRAVTITLKGLDLSHDPAIRHIEKLSLKLGRNDEMKCSKLVDLYVSGYEGPIMEAEYEGTLRPLTAREDRLLSEEVLRLGEVPRGQIQEGNPPPQ